MGSATKSSAVRPLAEPNFFIEPLSYILMTLWDSDWGSIF